MQVCRTPRDLYPGDPQCAPQSVVIAEAYVQLLRQLHTTDVWCDQVRHNAEELNIRNKSVYVLNIQFQN